MNLMVVEAVAKERINQNLMEAEKRRALKLAGDTNWWGRSIAHVLSGVAAKNQLIQAGCCANERTAACC